MKYPVGCDTPRERISYLLEAMERLRRLHNAIGTWRREGLTQAQHDQIPQKIKTLYPADLKLSEANWNKFVKDEYDPRAKAIMSVIPDMRKQLGNSNDWNVVAEDIEKE